MSDQENNLPIGRQENLITARGIVTESLPSTLFRVKLLTRNISQSGMGGESKDDDQKEILAYLGGKMRMHRIKVLIGDMVEVILDPYGGKGRIIKRL